MKNIKNWLGHKYFYLLLAELWTLIIAVLCLVSFSKFPKVKIENADKYVHFTFHFVFILLWYIYWKKANPQNRNTLLKLFFISLVFGILIEIAQGLFTTTRKADVFDVMANASGSIFAVITIVLYAEYIKKDSITK